eukprot:4719150-Amphidinium_carterae.2
MLRLRPKRRRLSTSESILAERMVCGTRWPFFSAKSVHIFAGTDSIPESNAAACTSLCDAGTWIRLAKVRMKSNMTMLGSGNAVIPCFREGSM